MNAPVDVNGDLMKVGDLVAYTTNDRCSGLQFGVIDKIDEKFDTDWRGNTVVEYKIVVNKTDPRGNPIYDSYYKDGQKFFTDKQVKSGRLIYETGKFMIMP